MPWIGEEIVIHMTYIYNGKTIDLTGGYHDAGDHVKFGLPEAYAAFVLNMSYDTDKVAYVSCGEADHLEMISTRFADYLVKCAVLSNDGSTVEAYCIQVGMGGGGYDHGYWGAPEDQPMGNRMAYFSSASDPATDIVSLSAAALALHYKNFGGETYLNTAKKLFSYAQSNTKNVGQIGKDFYASSAWEDDYCLAAYLLYKITGENSYLTAFNEYANTNNAKKGWWPLGWDNVAPALAYYKGDVSNLNNVMGINDGNSTYGGYRCVSSWGSARYNTSMQYTGLLADKLNNSSDYAAWAEGQMKYLLGNNAGKQCFITGYNIYSPKYPHHRAASGYTGGDKGTTSQKYMLIGALVGGQKEDGSYTDSASDYTCNEVAIDYNATLVAAAAGLYNLKKTDSSQKVDSIQNIKAVSSKTIEPGQSVSGDSTTTQNQTTTTEKQTTTQKATTTAKQTTTQNQATTTEKQTTTQKATTTEKQTTTQKSTTTEKQITTQKSTTTEKQTTTQKATTTEKQTTTQKATTTEKQTTTQKATTTEKQTTTQKATTTEKTATTEGTVKKNTVYSIKFNGNGATSGKMSTMKALKYGKSYKLRTNKFKKTGYKFTGWNTKKNGTGKKYNNKAKIKYLTSKNGAIVTLYAQWTPIKYKIKFVGNGATSGKMKTLTSVKYGKKYKLAANRFKKKGYKFVGWNTKRNGKGKKISNKAVIKNLTTKSGKTVTLYAQWKKVK